MTKFENIQKYLLDEIYSGRIAPNMQLPSENQLAKQFKVSRMTARKCLKSLIGQNLAYSIHGKGTFVANKQEKIPIFLGKDMNFFESGVPEYKTKPYVELIKFDIRKTPDFLNKIYEEGQELIYYKRVIYVHSNPAVLEWVYLPKEFYPFVDKEYVTNNLIISSPDVKVYKIFQEFEAVIPPVELGDYLKLDNIIPVLKKNKQSVNADFSTVEYSENYYNQQFYRFFQHIQYDKD